MYSQFNGAMLIPASFFLSTFLYGIEELANQMEEPFTILPMQAFCDRIYNWCMEMTSWTPGDNGMPTTARYFSDESYLDANYNYRNNVGGVQVPQSGLA
jgi:Bestrophin, RFP-TM, chloride channel